MEGGLIANLRPLFCLVPLGKITRSPYSSRADYLCRFMVRADIKLAHIYLRALLCANRCVLYSQDVESFLGIVLPNFHTVLPLASLRHSQYSIADLPTIANHVKDLNPIRGVKYNNPSIHHNYTRLRNINLMSIASGVCHLLRPD